MGPARLKKLRLAVNGRWEVMPAAWACAWATLDPQAGPRPEFAAIVDLGAAQAQALDRSGATLLQPAVSGWPVQLDQLDHPPPLLFVQGDSAAVADAAHRVAVIGARACTPYGHEQATRFGSGFAAAGVTVVSGAARGVDQSAMHGAVQTGGRVVAVMGAGLDRIYPSSAEPLLRAIVAAGGAIVSEFPFGTPPQAGNFPRRNRVLAALCQAVVVVQATRRSGSMNTVGWALSLGREVWGVPGAVDCAASQGPHLLLREGASLAESPMDVLRVLEQRCTEDELGRESPALAALQARDQGLAELAEVTGRGEEIMLLELLDLEMRGLVIRLSSGLYHRCGPHRAQAP